MRARHRQQPEQRSPDMSQGDATGRHQAETDSACQHKEPCNQQQFTLAPLVLLAAFFKIEGLCGQDLHKGL